MSKRKCIDGNKVKCNYVRGKLKKMGLLCPVTDAKPEPEKIPKKRRKKGFFAEWFG
jgi:hypothetical protein